MVQGKLSQELAVIGSSRDRGGAGDSNGFSKIEAFPKFQVPDGEGYHGNLQSTKRATFSMSVTKR